MLAGGPQRRCAVDNQSTSVNQLLYGVAYSQFPPADTVELRVMSGGVDWLFVW